MTNLGAKLQKNTYLCKKNAKKFGQFKKKQYFCTLFRSKERKDSARSPINGGLLARPGGGIGRRVGLKHQWETVPGRSRPWVHRKEVYAMIIVPVKEGENIERAIKKFKRKFDKTGVVKELRRRQQFDKPSELKRIKMAHAKYVQSLHAHDDM